MMKLILLSLLFTLIPALVSAATNYIDVFQSMRNQTVWPVPECPGGEFVTSTFGVRTRGPDRVYDFHRGIDILCDYGKDIVASYAGKVVKVSTDSTGGFTVILVHELPVPAKLHHKREETTRFYTHYLHCSSAIVEVDDTVNAGDVIATVGDSNGRTLRPHLHQEIRLGTRCSLEYALDNPSSTCNTLNYDPAIHPLLLYPESYVGPSNVTVAYREDLSDTQTKVVRVSAPGNNPNVNFYKVVISNKVGRKKRDKHTLDLNRRIGFDASSTTALDTQDTNVPFLNPIPFGTKDTWSIDLRIPKVWYGEKSSTEVIVVVVKDIWGADSKVVFGRDEIW